LPIDVISAHDEEHDMHNVMAAQSAAAVEERDAMDAIEQAAPATEGTAGGFAGGARHMSDAATANDQAVRASVELLQRNAKTMQHALQCSARLAARLSERSAGHFGRAIGLSGETAEDADQKSLRNFQAIVQSGAVLTEIAQRLYEEWVDIARARIDRSFDRFDAFLQCRTPQEFTALQSEIVRDNMETFVGYAGKAGEHSARIAGEARQQTANGRETARRDVSARANLPTTPIQE
jgi:hypothetical protein